MRWWWLLVAARVAGQACCRSGTTCATCADIAPLCEFGAANATECTSVGYVWCEGVDVPEPSGECCDFVDPDGLCGTFVAEGGYCTYSQKCCEEDCGLSWYKNEGTPTYAPTAAPIAAPTITPMPTATFAPTRLAPVEKWGALRVDGTRIASNATGAPVQLAGVSLYWSNFGWEGEDFYTAGTIASLAQWPGLSVVRAAMGVEDESGYLDLPDYNKRLVEIVVEAAIENGIYVIIDWHSHEAENYPEAAKNFFAEMATAYGGYPNVIFEIYNEPEPLENRTWEVIKAHCEDVLAVIRPISDNLAIVGTRRWGQYPNESAADPVDDVNVAYSVHFYAGWEGHDDIKDAVHEAVELGAPIFASEWGQGCPHIACDLDRNNTESWIGIMDDYQISWVNWVLNDKSDVIDDTLSIFLPGVDPVGPWDDDDADYTDAGKYTKSLIARYAT
ncbi:hypothetical protein CTAYLR_001712 [Chrysophaeum taylorii]|uniref:Glycoside hydrolase family 5 domain-containing protein n=1 Tax=Chrysophaeum taylorii TaxID=2483200 RepID=A0AAD7U786_9STRA|nr:hypothetical protein CTAYLR_001712 [Chrysophaeum taylorii]